MGVISTMSATATELAACDRAHFASLRDGLEAGVLALTTASCFVVANLGKDARDAMAGAVPFLKLLGIVSGGWQMARAALVADRRLRAGTDASAFYESRIVTARFYTEQVLSQAPGLAQLVTSGATSVMALAEDQF
jgi:acyl-CoA dehydrogenase